MRASCTAAAITGPATTWVATSCAAHEERHRRSTSRNGAGGFSVWRARVAAISRRESVELALAAPLGRSETGAMVVGMGSSCRGIGRKIPKFRVKFRVGRPPIGAAGCTLPAVGLVRGFMAPFRGGALIARHRLWHYLVLPILLNVALGIRGAVPGRTLLARRGLHRGAAHQGPGGRLADPGCADHRERGGALSRGAADPLGRVLRSALRAGRARVRGTAPTAPFLASTGRALAHGLLKLVLYALVMLMAFVLSLWTAGMGAIAGVALAGLFIAYDGFDYPLSRRGASFGRKWAYLATHPVQTIGFGMGATLLYLVPFALFVAPSFVAAGATALFVEGGEDEKVAKKDAEKVAKQEAEQEAKKDEKKDLPNGEGEGRQAAKNPAEM